MLGCILIDSSIHTKCTFVSIQVRCEEISLRRKRDALQRERQVQGVLGDIVPSEWPKEVSVARGKSLPQFKFYGIVSQSFKVLPFPSNDPSINSVETIPTPLLLLYFRQMKQRSFGIFLTLETCLTRPGWRRS